VEEGMTTSAPTPVIDTRALPTGTNCRDTVIDRFDRLEPGQALRVVTDHDPRPLLRHMLRERAGLFEWTPLEAGPAVWRTELFRRAANRGELRRVTEALGWDHDRLDILAGDAFGQRALGRYEAARQLWEEFSSGLRRHIRFEEEILFPAFEEKTGLPRDAGPTAVMRAEHRRIEGLLEAVAAVIAAPGPAAAALRAQLDDLLLGHNEKEEMVLYPGIDNLLSAEECDELVARIQLSA
jgi:uncharacterized protein (DUF2249 family)/hemerythrin-like domain-containing protein